MALPEPQEQLCFSPEELLNSDFQVDDFVSRCRKRATMEGLREELHSYFKTLKSAMVELINKDYADFVNLSANLAGIDKSIGSLMSPLKQLQVEIKDIKGAMDEAILSVQSELNGKSEISEQKTTLRRLIAILESMDRLERLLHIQPSKDASEIESLSQRSEWGPIVMERVAMEFNKLQYNVSLVTTHPLIEDSNERIAAITRSLQSWLESSFRAGLTSEDRGALISCLETYTHIGRQEAAEGMFRHTVIRPHLSEILTTKNLISHPQGLSGLYTDILTFVPQHCALLVDITSRGSPSEGHTSSVSGFDFLVNSVWPEVVSLIEQKVSVIFAPGNPDTFHQNYTTSMEFVTSFEKLCSTEDSVKRLRAHPSYNSFMSKWSLPVYFQIRFQEIAGSVESSLVLPLQRSQSEGVGTDQPLFKLGIFQGVWSALLRCWSPEVFLPALVHRLWKLSLQIVARAALWLEGLCGDQSEPSSVEATPTLPDCLLIIADLKQLSSQCQESLASMILPRIPDHMTDLVKGGIDDAREKLDQLVPRYAAHVVEDIATECSKSIESVQTIPRLFRRTNRQAPSKPSTFTAAILSPLEQRLEHFPPQYKQEWIKNIIESVTEKYYRLTSELLMSVKRTEDSLLKLNAYRKSSAPVSSGQMTDDNKIRLQVALDIEHYSMQVARLDSQCLQLTAVKQLLVMGQTSKSVAMETVQEH